MGKINVLIICLMILCGYSKNYIHAYRPVVIIHGIMTGAPSMKLIEEEIKVLHPGTIVYNTDRFSGWSSLENAWHQVDELGKDLLEICEKYPDGINLIGYSQGGLIARGILETFTNHNVRTFISLSSPQAGQYGTEFLHLIFPSLVAKTAYELFYSYVGQHTSVGNYWNDPHRQDLYREYSSFLPYINNEILTTNSTRFRSGLVKLDKLILIGGPDDGVITPWQSSHFGYFDGNDHIVPMHHRDIYQRDSIGLKQLEEEKKLKILVFPGVHHMEWHMNINIIRKAILPYLD